MNKYATKATGWAAVFAALGAALKALADSDPTTVVDWNVLIPTLIAAFGLTFARSNKTTSEEAGAKPEGSK